LIETVLDAGSWKSWDEQVTHDSQGDYGDALREAERISGHDESIRTGEGRIRGRRVAVVAGEFSFLAGSIGIKAADRLVAAVRRATAECLPLVASPASGGTRMQEGTRAFIQMLPITESIAAHRQAGLAYLVYLRHPTTGGVFASWGSLGHVTVAEPGALIGFLGPRVFEALYGEQFPPGVQKAENLYEHGLVDAVLTPEALPEIADRALSILCGEIRDVRECPDGAVMTSTDDLPDVPAWDSVTISRRKDRPGVRRLLVKGAEDVVVLHGTGEGETEPGMLLALARFGGVPCVVLGQDRRGQTQETPLGPGALRAARRGMRISVELHLPIVTVIDTPGAALSREAEEGGLAGEIARSLHDLISLPSPSLAVLLGQGTGGGALALLPADRVICAEHAWLAPLPPEGASELVYRTTSRAPEIAAAQGICAKDLLASGVVDGVVLEGNDGEASLVRNLADAIGRSLRALVAQEDALRVDRRRMRLQSLGHAIGPTW